MEPELQASSAHHPWQHACGPDPAPGVPPFSCMFGPPVRLPCAIRSLIFRLRLLLPFQGSNLYSADQQVYLTTTSTGNLELINVAAYNTYGATPPSLIWQSQTSSTAGPFSLVMQEVRPQALSLHAGCDILLGTPCTC